MKQPVHLAIYGLTWLLLLLSSCAKTEDPPTPHIPAISSSQWVRQADIQHLRQLLLQQRVLLLRRAVLMQSFASISKPAIGAPPAGIIMAIMSSREQ